jgi:hypothetical protein
MLLNLNFLCYGYMLSNNIIIVRELLVRYH